MGRLVYSAITSLDGYVNDRDGGFGWAMPDDEVHQFVNDAQREVGTYLYGRRLYDVMAVWESWATEDEPEPVKDFQRIWRAADKVVYSRALDAVSTPRTRLERSFDPDAVRALVEAAPTDVTVGGATLAAEAFRAGLVDACDLYLNPVAVGGGTPALPTDTRVDLTLTDNRRFGNGVVLLRYRVSRARPTTA
jgi:dihydrofolate reductase